MRTGINRYQDIEDIDRGRLDEKTREDLILKYSHLVKYIADRMSARLPSNVSRDELASAGIVGLLDSLDKFDSKMGIKFQTYAEYRIKGAILDELRKMDWIPRSIRKDIHRVENAMVAVRSRLGREPEDFEVAQEMGVDIDSYYKIIGRTQGVGILSLDEIMPDGSIPKFAKHASSDMPSPFDVLKVKELKQTLAKVILTLSKKEQLVLSLYYYEEMTLKEIAKILGLTESRVSQVHAKAIIRMRTKLRSYREG